MINVAAIRMKQFGVQFYQASLTAGDIDKLVRFEVLNYGQYLSYMLVLLPMGWLAFSALTGRKPGSGHQQPATR